MILGEVSMTKRKREHKWIKWIFFLGLIVAAVVVCYFVWDGYFRDKKGDDATSQNTTSLSSENKSQSEEKTPEVPSEEISKEDLEEGKKVSQYEGGDANSGDSLTGAITYVGESGGVVSIWVNIDQYVTSGTCALRIIRAGGVEYEETVPLIADITTSTCEGFSFAKEKLASGEGEIVIDLVSGDKRGVLKGDLSL